MVNAGWVVVFFWETKVLLRNPNGFSQHTQIQLLSRDLDTIQTKISDNQYNESLAWDMPQLLQAADTEQELGMFLKRNKVKKRTDMLSSTNPSVSQVLVSDPSTALLVSPNSLQVATIHQAPKEVNKPWRWQ